LGGSEIDFSFFFLAFSPSIDPQSLSFPPPSLLCRLSLTSSRCRFFSLFLAHKQRAVRHNFYYVPLPFYLHGGTARLARVLFSFWCDRLRAADSVFFPPLVWQVGSRPLKLLLFKIALVLPPWFLVARRVRFSRPLCIEQVLARNASFFRLLFFCSPTSLIIRIGFLVCSAPSPLRRIGLPIAPFLPCQFPRL